MINLMLAINYSIYYLLISIVFLIIVFFVNNIQPKKIKGVFRIILITLYICVLLLSIGAIFILTPINIVRLPEIIIPSHHLSHRFIIRTICFVLTSIGSVIIGFIAFKLLMPLLIKNKKESMINRR